MPTLLLLILYEPATAKQRRETVGTCWDNFQSATVQAIVTSRICWIFSKAMSAAAARRVAIEVLGRVDRNMHESGPA